MALRVRVPAGVAGGKMTPVIVGGVIIVKKPKRIIVVIISKSI